MWAAVSAGPEYVDGTLGSSIVCCAADVLGMSGEKCVKCVYDWGGVGGDRGEWLRGLALGFANPVETVGVLDECLCLGCDGVCGVGRKLV